MINLFKFINLHQGEERKDKVLENVSANISFRGSNLWILACAIIIASIGLNVNSTAVIIGAMLISPLMGPIVGAGFALGTYNFPLLKKSIKNLLIATFVSLAVSALYFYVSPFKDVQSEILARTSPNIYDVLIAFFGGLVGVIAITRVEKGNPIPGVAIATALMPPLCTAGFGVATFNLPYFLGAFYLYSINCFFIGFATFLVVKYLKYPSAIVDNKYEKRIKYSITLLIIIMIVPSFYLAYNLYYEKKFSKTAEVFLKKEFENKGYTLIYKKLDYKSTPKLIDVAFLNKKFTAAEIESFNKLLSGHGLSNTAINIRQNNSDLKSEILKEIGDKKNMLSEKDITIANIRQELDRYTVADSTLSKEIQILFPQISDIAYGKLEKYPETDSTLLQFTVIYSGQNINKAQLKRWLEQRIGKEVQLYETSENP